MKEFSYNVYRNPFSSVLVKLGVCFLLLGLAYRLFSSSFVLFSPPVVNDNDLALSADENFSPHVAEPQEIGGDRLVNLDDYTSQNGENFPYFIEYMHDISCPCFDVCCVCSCLGSEPKNWIFMHFLGHGLKT